MTAERVSVMVDDEPLAADSLGLTTVGQVLSHLTAEQRLVTQVLIDGIEPPPEELPRARATPLAGHVVYVETAEPARIAQDVLDGVAEQLDAADAARADAADLLQRGDEPSRALQKLAGCFAVWQGAQDAVAKVAELLRLDVRRVVVDGRPLPDLLADFAAHLRTVKQAIEGRDFVTLADVLLYELDRTCAQWREAIRQVRGYCA